MASNPVVQRFGQGAVPGGPSPSVDQLNTMYNQPSFTPTPARYMTLDDVVQRMAAMLGVLLVTGGLSWGLTDSTNVTPLALIGLVGGLGLGLFISFTGKANAVTCLLYSAFEGVLLGSISRVFDAWKHGIVIQALTGTIVVAAGMLFVYRIGAIRVTPRFTRVVVGATIGVLGLMIVNMLAYLVHPGGLGLREGGAMAIIFSLVCIGIASMNLVLDFDMVEQGIRRGADEKFAWYASFGLMVTLVWLYLEILRLLGYLGRSN